MSDSAFYATIREAPFGQLVRFLTRNKYFKYQEELPGFEIPWQKEIKDEKEAVAAPQPQAEPEVSSSGATTPVNEGVDLEKEQRNSSPAPPKDLERLEQIPTAKSDKPADRTQRTLSRHSTPPFSRERYEAEQEGELERAQSSVIVPTRTADGVTLVDWYTTDDPENPQHWSSMRKINVVVIIFIYTFAAYVSSAIYTPSTEGVMQHFNVSIVAASLGLSMYVLGYGLGPLLFSPLSEIPVIGRNPPYIISWALFVILAVPTALVDNFAGLLVLRFITGFMSAPALATGAASMQDIYSFMKLPYALSAWAAAAFCGPALGPLLSGFAVMNKGWRWSLWEILWLAGPVWILMFFFLPETNSNTLLLRRAQRLRKLTNDSQLKSQSEIDQANLKFSTVAANQLIKPFEIMIKDPAVLFTNIYSSAIYGIYYSFFEVFPLVYRGIYGFNLGTLGCAFLVIIVGCALAVAIYCSLVYFVVEPGIKKNGMGPQESALIPGLVAVVLLPIALFWFGWTSHASIPWIVPTIGLCLFPLGGFILFQCIFLYLPISYPQYAASLFAGNDVCRSAFAAGAILYAHALYINLGIGKGCSLLGGLLCGGCLGVWALYYYGGTLRARSSFATK